MLVLNKSYLSYDLYYLLVWLVINRHYRKAGGIYYPLLSDLSLKNHRRMHNALLPISKQPTWLQYLRFAGRIFPSHLHIGNNMKWKGYWNIKCVSGTKFGKYGNAEQNPQNPDSFHNDNTLPTLRLVLRITTITLVIVNWAIKTTSDIMKMVI